MASTIGYYQVQICSPKQSHNALIQETTNQVLSATSKRSILSLVLAPGSLGMATREIRFEDEI